MSDSVWNAYIDKFGTEPANASQLSNFAQQYHSIKLSFKKARELFNKNKGKGKIHDHMHCENQNDPNSEKDIPKTKGNEEKKQDTEQDEITKYAILCKENPNDFQANLKYAAALHLTQQLEEAELYYQKCLNMDPMNFKIGECLLRLYNQQGKYKENLPYVQKLIQCYPEHSIFHHYSAFYKYKLELYSEALLDVRKAIKCDMGDIENQQLEIEILRASKKWSDAENVCVRMLKKHPDNITFATQYLIILRELKKYNEATKFWKSSNLKHNADPACLNLYSALLTDNNQYSEAEKYLKKALESEPTQYINIYINYLETLKALNKTEEALLFCKQTIEKYQKNYKWYLEASMILQTQNDLKQALFYAEQAYFYDKQTLERTIFYAVKFADLGDYDKAKAIMQSLLKKYENNFIVIIGYAECEVYYKKAADIEYSGGHRMVNVGFARLYVRCKQWEKSLPYIQRVIEWDETMKDNAVDPSPAEIMYGYANALSELNRTKEAAIQYRKLLQLYPCSDECHVEFGVMLIEKLHDWDEGIKHLEKAVELEPNEKKYAAKLREYQNKYKKENMDRNIDIDDEKKNECVVGIDMVPCKQEFNRFLSLIPNGTKKYLDQFIENDLNDIRYIDVLDEDILRNDVKMKVVDSKILMKKITKYKTDHQEFEKYLNEYGMTAKYQTVFENNGIATFWSFHHHIKSLKDIDMIIKNQADAKMLWNGVKQQSRTTF